MRTSVLIVALALGACGAQPTNTPPTQAAAESTTTTAVTPPAVADLALVETPKSGAQITSPLHITGTAPANWFFENSFPVQLIDARGAVLAEAPANPRTSWTDPGPKTFDATLTFTATGAATLVLQEDMPGDGKTPREVRVPVVLTH